MATAKKPTTAKRPTAARKPRSKRPGPMPKEVREAGAAALAMFEERLLEHEGIGLSGSATRELRGARSGMVKAVRFEGSNGTKHRATLTVAYR